MSGSHIYQWAPYTRVLFSKTQMLISDYRKGFPGEITKGASGSASVICSLIDGKRTKDQLVEIVEKSYLIERAVADKDVAMLLTELEGLGFIIRSSCTRRPLQILVIPFVVNEDKTWSVAVLERADLKVWQFIAGGVECNESPYESANRESLEEIGVLPKVIFRLDSHTIMDTSHFKELDQISQLSHVLEYAYAAQLDNRSIELSSEHTDIRWVSPSDAVDLLAWDSNRAALLDLELKLKEKYES